MTFGYSRVTSIAIVFALMLFVSACNRQSEQATTAQPDTAAQQGGQQGAAPAETAPAPAPTEPAAQPAPAQSSAPRTAARTSSRPAAKPAEMARSAAPEAAAAPKVQSVVLDAGTVLRVRTTSTISTKTATAGDVFEASLAEPVTSGGREVLPKGAAVQGRVVEADAGGRVKGLASLSLALTSVTVRGNSIPIATSAVSKQAETTKKKDAAKVGIGAGIGAAIGAIAGGGKGAAIGAATGGGAGTAAVLATRGDAAVVPAESVLSFQLAKPVTLR